VNASPAFAAYYRVSTDRQGRSGLELEAQREAVARFLAGHPGAALLGELTEVESGSRADRPQLAAALALARRRRRRRATLVIAKLDRLARSVAFIAGLMEGSAPFVACDKESARPAWLRSGGPELVGFATSAAHVAPYLRPGLVGSRHCAMN